MRTLKLTVIVSDDVVAALDESGLPLRAQIRPVLSTSKGGVITMGKAWMGREVVVVEMPRGAPAKKKASANGDD